MTAWIHASTDERPLPIVLITDLQLERTVDRRTTNLGQGPILSKTVESSSQGEGRTIFISLMREVECSVDPFGIRSTNTEEQYIIIWTDPLARNWFLLYDLRGPQNVQHAIVLQI